MKFKTCKRQPIVVLRYEMKRPSWLGVAVILGWAFLSSGASELLAVQPQVAAGEYHTVGLKSEVTAVAVKFNYCIQLNVEGWDGKYRVL